MSPGRCPGLCYDARVAGVEKVVGGHLSEPFRPQRGHKNIALGNAPARAADIRNHHRTTVITATRRSPGALPRSML